MKYADLSASFAQHHRHPLNVALHAVTTPLGAIAAIHLLALLDPRLALAIVCLYALALSRLLPLGVWIKTCVLLTLVSWTGLSLELGWIAATVLLATAYVAQDLAHALTGERTLQSAYDRQSSWAVQFFEHSFFLLPLVVDSAIRARLIPALLEQSMPRSGLLETKLHSTTELADLQTLRAWVLAQNPAQETTTHWWTESLSSDARAAFERLVASPTIAAMFRERYGEGVFAIEPVTGMNEVYVASLSHKNNSDAVFYTPHIDGPYMLYPFASVFRCIVAVNENVSVRTIFPMTPAQSVWSTGDVGAFDFNREPHFIERLGDSESTEVRITLKLHYCVYPRIAKPYGRLLSWLNTRYDVIARGAFLKSLRPATIVERALAAFIMVCTRTYNILGTHLGGNNLAYLATLAVLDHFLAAPIFLLGTSFVHYLLYFATYYARDGVSFHRFKRDAMLYKTLAIVQAALIYLEHYTFDAISLSLIALGISLSSLAAWRLGTVRTYFGVELGLASRQKITAFPYNVLPHPMILGNIITLLGLMKMDGFREAVPYLAPLHIAFYAAHMFQEHFDLHRRRWATPAAQ